MGILTKYINKIKEFDNSPDDNERTTQLFALSAIYDNPDRIIEAAQKVADEGYEKFDVYTPYPVHGMDDAMRMKPTMIGKLIFACGAIGTSLALLMMGWMSGINYKNIVGAKPFFSLPPSIPITFEVTVLLAGITATFGMLILYNKLPKIDSPLQDTEFMKRVSSDKFGIIIQADDDKFIESDVRNLFQSTGGTTIEKIFYRPTNLTKKTPLFDKKFTLAIIVTALLTAGASYLTMNIVLYSVVPFDWLWTQPRIDSQSKSDFFPNKSGMRMPVNGTVARGFLPYDYVGAPDSVVKLISNPLPIDKRILDRGQKEFNIYCSPCHGYYGDGESRLHGQFPKPPSYHTDKVRNWPDANIYNVITNGQNVMPSYAEQVSRDDRWAIIHYIRVLQRAKNASDNDLPK